MNIPDGFYPIKNCGLRDGYYITKDGVVASTLKGDFSILKTRLNVKGYVDVQMCKEIDSSRRPYNIHRAMALTFIENPNNHPVVNHINGVKHDNRVENLEWCTISYNTKHGYDICGVVNGKQNIVKSTDTRTGESIVFNSVNDACKHYGVNQSDISHRVSGKTSNPTKVGKLKGIKFEYIGKPEQQEKDPYTI